MAPSIEKEHILVVDDAPNTLEVLRRNLESQGYKVFTAPGVVEAIKILDATPVDLVITDLKMPRVSGLDLVRHVRENFKDTEVMMITGYATVEGAVRAVKTGAEEYLPKPFTDEELFSAVRRSLDKLHAHRAGLSKVRQVPRDTYGILGESAEMQKVLEAIAKVSLTSATVLITGESGTGKELVARAIHYNSPRAAAPFVAINCGGIPEQLLESELFGYVKGAFTGATESRAGFFQTADGGTIFLDEISDTSPSMQIKLPFREDLFFRLNVITIPVPPLRQRGNDILLLAHHFAVKFAGELGKPTPRFSDSSLQVLRNYYWPGNVRELENVIQRFVVMTDGDVMEVPDMPPLMRFSALRETGLNRTLAELEAEYIRNVLASVDGNKTQAARILGIDRKTLREKLKPEEAE